ncbi:MAG TPA: hypothetical protein VMW51_09695 [Terriglobia bacterium]|nr:hypothetical protein [Terriglobia bacterium]
METGIIQSSVLYIPNIIYRQGQQAAVIGQEIQDVWKNATIPWDYVKELSLLQVSLLPSLDVGIAKVP